MHSFHVLIVVFASVQLIYCRNIQRLSCSQIRQFVDGHNSRRQQIAKGEVKGQPAATDMKYMAWDDELAAKAAKWASNNNFYHNPDRSIGSGRFSTGENLYWFSTSDKREKFNIDSALNSWFTEHKNYKFNPLTMSDFQRSSDMQIGHYTQMAWSDTTRVGCAIAASQAKNMYNYFVVCNYGPNGNILGDVPYKSGKRSYRLICDGDNCSKPYGNKC